MQHNHTRFALTLGAALGLYAAAPAWAITPPGTPPTFFCDANRPANADTVEAQFNTLAPTNDVTAADRGNQPRWEWAAPASGVGLTAGPDPLPGGLSWTHFTGREMVGYLGIATRVDYPRTFIGFYPAQAGAVSNTIRYFRYQFYLDASVDPTTYRLNLTGARADDAFRGTYLNGTRVSPALATTIGGGATPFQPGLNELTFAIFDNGPSATWMGIQNVTQSGCNVLPPAPDTALTPPASVNTATAPTFSGTASNAPAGSTVTIVIRDAGGNVVDTLTTTTDAAGAYSITRAAPLPVGTYTIESAVAGDATPATGPLVVTAAPDTALTPPASVNTATPPTFSGTASNAPAGSTVTIVIRDAGGNVVDTLTTTTDAAGAYSITRAAPLPEGTYTIESAVAGDTSPASAPLVITPLALPDTALPPPASVNTTTPPTFSGTASNAPAGSTVTIVIRDAGGNVVDTLTTTTDAAGAYSITRTAPLPEGTYTIESAVAGDATPATRTLVVTPAGTPAGPVAVPTLGAWSLGLLSAVLGALGMRRRQRRSA